MAGAAGTDPPRDVLASRRQRPRSTSFVSLSHRYDGVEVQPAITEREEA
jgi:hypothetical protein